LKKFLVLVLIIAIFLTLTGCYFDSDTYILRRLEKTLDKYTGYKTDLYMKITMNNIENKYKMRETNTLGDKYKLEFLEPIENLGMIIEYKDDKIYIKNASFKQSMEINSVKNFDQGLLIGKFYRELDNIKSIKVEEVDDVVYYVFTNKVEDKNKYNNKQEIWLKKKDLKPYVLKIFDRDKNPRVIIEYKNFEFSK